MRFDASSGRLTDFGMIKDVREVVVDSSKLFQTSGCSGHDSEISACNRPSDGGYSLIPVYLQCPQHGAGTSTDPGRRYDIFDEEASKNEAITPCFRESVAGGKEFIK